MSVSFHTRLEIEFTPHSPGNSPAQLPTSGAVTWYTGLCGAAIPCAMSQHYSLKFGQAKPLSWWRCGQVKPEWHWDPVLQVTMSFFKIWPGCPSFMLERWLGQTWMVLRHHAQNCNGWSEEPDLFLWDRNHKWQVSMRPPATTNNPSSLSQLQNLHGLPLHGTWP